MCREFLKCRIYAFWGTFLTFKFCLGNGQALLETVVHSGILPPPPPPPDRKCIGSSWRRLSSCQPIGSYWSRPLLPITPIFAQYTSMLQLSPQSTSQLEICVKIFYYLKHIMIHFGMKKLS